MNHPNQSAFQRSETQRSEVESHSPDLCRTRTALRKPIPQRFRCPQELGAAGAFQRRDEAFVTSLAGGSVACLSGTRRFARLECS
jgi:hypothetical protein